MHPCSVLSKVTCASWAMAAEQCGVRRSYFRQNLQASQQPGSIAEWACVVKTCLCKHVQSHSCCFLVKGINITCGMLYLVVVESHNWLLFPPMFFLKNMNITLTSGRWPAKGGVDSALPAFLVLIRMPGRGTGGFHLCSRKRRQQKIRRT